ncbi:MAG: hypothetical protein OXU20_33670 [Myxococcales bacterium]|nr:hypothetical protein [Myxococcales bacterium]MDD9971099.1 hypothetical protein [Myxococcales bacterium]
MQQGIIATLILSTSLLTACGGDSDDSSSAGASFADISGAVAAPTGTVDADTAPAVAMEYELLSVGGAAIPKQASATQMMECPAGGNINVQAQGDGNGATANLSFNDCCYEASCCIGGGGTWYFSTEDTADYTYCASYDMNVTCGTDDAGSVNYEGCFDLTGGWVLVVRVNGQTFAVNGEYVDGNGTLDIKGTNGEFTCTYENGTGSCNGTAGMFSF